MLHGPTSNWRSGEGEVPTSLGILLRGQGERSLACSYLPDGPLNRQCLSWRRRRVAGCAGCVFASAGWVAANATRREKGDRAMKRVLLAACFVLLVATGVRAEDVEPPTGRGSPGYACQEWDFVTDVPPEGYYPPDGLGGITDYDLAELHISDGTYLPSVGPGPGGAWAFADDSSKFGNMMIVVREPVFGSLRDHGHVQVTFDNRKPEPWLWVDHASSRYRVLDVPGHPDWSVSIMDYERERGVSHTIFVMDGRHHLRDGRAGGGRE